MNVHHHAAIVVFNRPCYENSGDDISQYRKSRCRGTLPSVTLGLHVMHIRFSRISIIYPVYMRSLQRGGGIVDNREALRRFLTACTSTHVDARRRSLIQHIHSKSIQFTLRTYTRVDVRRRAQ
jgi:hypothetical protein